MTHRNITFFTGLQAVGLFSIGFTLITAGCDDARQSAAPTTKPAALVAINQPADQAAVLVSYPARPPAIFSIDGRDVDFPAARLAVIGHNGGLTLRLCSDDPPTAIDPGYAGNSFILDMRLAIDRVDDLPACTWDHKPADADDAISGIFVHGYRDGLRPYDVHITFQKTDGQTLAYVDGTFLRNDNQMPAAPPERVHISGCLRVSGVE